jgi:hypothetical protein
MAYSVHRVSINITYLLLKKLTLKQKSNKGRVTIIITIFWDMIPCSVVERTNIMGELADSIFWVEENLTEWNLDT